MWRASSLLFPLAIWSAPSLAQSSAPVVPGRVAASPLAIDPGTAARLADAAQSLSRVVLDLRVGGLTAALEGRKPSTAEKDLTVRDLARKKDPDFERHLDQQIAAAKPGIERSVQAMNEALPALQKSLADAQRAIERAMANMPDPNYPKR